MLKSARYLMRLILHSDLTDLISYRLAAAHSRYQTTATIRTRLCRTAYTGCTPYV